MNTDRSARDIDQEWEARTLCSDEGCIGVIGPDDRCKECGLRYQGELAPPSTPLLSTGPDDPAASRETAELSDPDDADDPDDVPDDEWSRRKLCSDESCIGVVGADGRCKECGRPYEP